MGTFLCLFSLFCTAEALGVVFDPRNMLGFVGQGVSCMANDLIDFLV